MDRHLNVSGNVDLINLDRSTIFEFYNGYGWVSLAKQSDEFFAPKSLIDRFRGVNTMKNSLGINKTLKRSFQAATKLKSELPTDLEMEYVPPEELSSLVEDVHTNPY